MRYRILDGRPFFRQQLLPVIVHRPRLESQSRHFGKVRVEEPL
jgi:hypothetical protein